MLIGRVAERQALARLAAAARVSESSALVLIGEAGQGKTALLTEFVGQCDGLRVLWVRGSETERALPFSGLDQLLRPLLGYLGDLPVPQAHAVEVALALGPGTATDRFAISAATLSLLVRAAEETPTLVVVDDGHALDAPSAEALAFTARRFLADPLAMVVATRPGRGPLLDAGLPHLELGGLSTDEVRRLLGDRSASRVSAELAARVHGATAGNPLAVAELAPGLDEVEASMPVAALAVPDRVVAEFARRAATLAPRVRSALLIAAVADPADSAAALDRMGFDLADLQPAAGAGLIELLHAQVEFRHPLARASIQAGASLGQRQVAHLAVASVAGDPDRRAWHLAEGTVGLDAGVADAVAAAAERTLARGAFSVAASAFERAAELTPARELRAARLLAAGEAATLAGRGSRASALLDRSATESGDTGHRARVDALRALVEQRWGSLERSRELGMRALVALARADPDAAIDTAADLVTTCLYLGDTALAERTASLLDEAAKRCSANAAVRALLAGGVARVLAGQDGLGPIREAMAAMTTGDRAVSAAASADQRLRPSWLVMGPLFVREESAAARELVEQALRRLRESSAVGPLASLLFHVARYAATTDRWDEAAEQYQEGCALARESGQTTDLTMLLAGLAWLEARTGAGDCREHAAQALLLAERHHVHVGKVWTLYALGDLELGAGRPGQALAHYASVAAFLQRIGFRDVDVSPAPEIVECLVRLGRDAEARPAAEEYRHQAEAKANSWALARSARAQALLAPHPEAGLRRALEQHAAGPDRYEEARTLLALGEALRRGRRRTQARDVLRRALDTFEPLGARPWAARAAAELEATGEHAHRRSDRSIDLLTPQELQVARLLATGLTTRQAAAAMFLSPKTVEYHLRHVYTKLDLNNRAALAEALGGGSPPGPGVLRP